MTTRYYYSTLVSEKSIAALRIPGKKLDTAGEFVKAALVACAGV
jgi:hypothetical protein